MKDMQQQMERLKAELRQLERRLAALERAQQQPVEPPVPEEPGRRKTPRRKALLRADYSDGRSLYTDPATDISEGGACLRSGQPQPVGCRLEMVFDVPSLGQPLKVKGEIVRVAELSGGRGAPQYALGIRFLSTDAYTQNLLRQLVSTLPADKSRPAFEEKDKDAWLAKIKDMDL
jgi:hypothetical protein